jgi:hypothetical protein
MTVYGAFNPPPNMPAGSIEHIFARSDALSWVPAELDRIRQQDRVPLLTIEPWTGIGDTLDFVASAAVRSADPLWLRYGHEFNGDRYPWSLNATQLRRDWYAIESAIRAVSAPIKHICCPNIAFPGSKPLVDFWPGVGIFAALGVDGYDQINGAAPESFHDLFTQSVATFKALAPALPIWVCETAHPRRYAERLTGAGQAGWINDLRADAKRMGLAAVVWFNQDKDDGKWALGPAGARALFRGPA